MKLKHQWTVRPSEPSNIYVIGVLEEEKKEEKLFEISRVKKIKISWKALTNRLRFSVGQRRVNIKKTTPKYTIVKLVKTKDKKKNLKSSQRKKAHYIPENNDNIN